MAAKNTEQPMWSEQFLEGHIVQGRNNRGIENRSASEALTWITCFLVTVMVFVMAFLIQIK